MLNARETLTWRKCLASMRASMDVRLRNRFAFLAVLLLASMTGHSALGEGGAIAKEAKEFYDNVKELLEWSEWTQETGLRMLDGNPAHPAPGSLNGEKFEKRLEGAIDKVKDLSLPAFSIINDDLVGLGGLSADDRRA